MNLLKYHYVTAFKENITKFNDKLVVFGKNNGNWEGISWKILGDLTNSLSKSLLRFNVKPQDTVGIFAQNMPQWTITDLSTLQIRAVTVPIYATNTAEQASYIINHATIKILLSVAKNNTTKPSRLPKNALHYKKS